MSKTNPNSTISMPPITQSTNSVMSLSEMQNKMAETLATIQMLQKEVVDLRSTQNVNTTEVSWAKPITYK